MGEQMKIKEQMKMEKNDRGKGWTVHRAFKIRNKSVMAELANKVSRTDVSDETLLTKLNKGEIDKTKSRLEKHRIRKYYYVVLGYILYKDFLEGLFDSMTGIMSNKKHVTLMTVIRLYKECLYELGPAALARAPDAVMDRLIEKLNIYILQGANLDADNESVGFTIIIIVSYAFYRGDIFK